MSFPHRALRKAPTGIEGLDEVTHGGLPYGRTTLVAGTAGCGKTTLAMEFLIRGAVQYGEPGVFLAFEEREDDLARNIASFGYDLEELQRQEKIAVDHFQVDRHELVEAGNYDLEGLLIRLGCAVEKIGAKRVVLDTLEALFSIFQDHAVIRTELNRLFRWLKERNLTAIVTGERGNGTITRFGLEEYVADCVILLDHRVTEQISTRRLRIVKYRGGTHEMDEHPFLIGHNGISVLPVTSIGLNHTVSAERVSSGIADLDAMLGGQGFYRGSSILLSGTAGTGKSSLAFTFLAAACKRGESAVYFGFEESMAQSTRNMRSIGIDLQTPIEQGLLHVVTSRPSSMGLESHLAVIHETIQTINPKVVVLDPISNFMSIGDAGPIKSMLTRLVDFLKTRQITAFFTHLSSANEHLEITDQRISSIMDTWMLLRDLEDDGRRSSAFYVLKSRGMKHSRESMAFSLTDQGIFLSPKMSLKSQHS